MPTSKEQKPVTGTKNAARHSRAAFFLVAISILAVFACFLAGFTALRLNARAVPVPTADKAKAIGAYEEAHWASLHPFPSARDLYPWTWEGTGGTVFPSAQAVALDVNARSAILVDAATGAVLFEKNADELIPPASMTKLVTMYTAFRAIQKGEISLDDEISPPSESWAINIPAGSSLMFLAPGQRLTVRELLLGMAVVSGNDAAIAVACHVSGSVPAFVERMNMEVASLGLTHTHFVEPSGLSELNVTTAREFADFARVYVASFPEALAQFHSVRELSYPLERNLPAGSKERPIEQEATNKLLGVLDGCDGLKTGFIRESGFNLSLTASRNGNRFISVSLGGPGATNAEGSLLRSKDGTLLMEWAFANFRTARPERAHPVSVTVWKGESGAIEAIPAGSEDFTVPADAFQSSPSGTGTASIEYDVPRAISSPVHAGDRLGTVRYSIGGFTVHEMPLVADRTVHTAGIARRALDKAAMFAAEFFPHASTEYFRR